MRNKIAISVIFLLASVGVAQVPGTQIPLTGSIGINGNASLLGYQNIVFTSDSNLTLTATQWSSLSLIVTSSVPLTVTRNLVLPANTGQMYLIKNATAGNNSIYAVASGAVGTGVLIPSGSSMLIYCDGKNYNSLSVTSSPGGDTSTLSACYQFSSLPTPVAGSYTCASNPTLSSVLNSTVVFTPWINSSGGDTLTVDGDVTHSGVILQGLGGSQITANQLVAHRTYLLYNSNDVWILVGSIPATTINGIPVPANASLLGTNSASQLIQTTSIASGVTAVTQAVGDYSTKIATDGFVSTAVANSCYGYNNCPTQNHPAPSSSSPTLTSSITATSLTIPISNSALLSAAGCGPIFDATTLVEWICWDSNAAGVLTLSSVSERGLFGTTARSWGAGTFYISQAISIVSNSYASVPSSFTLQGGYIGYGQNSVPLLYTNGTTLNAPSAYYSTGLVSTGGGTQAPFYADVALSNTARPVLQYNPNGATSYVATLGPKGTSALASGGTSFGCTGPASSAFGGNNLCGIFPPYAAGATAATPAAWWDQYGDSSVGGGQDATTTWTYKAGVTASQIGNIAFADWDGTAKWFVQKSASNQFNVVDSSNSAVRLGMIPNSTHGDTYLNSAGGLGAVNLNYTVGSGSGGTYVWSGGATPSMIAGFISTSATTGVEFPGIKSSSGYNCLQVDASGYLSNTGAVCGSGGGSGLSGMTAGQVPIAATATTVTSSKSLAGTGAGIVTGPTFVSTGDVATFSGTTGQIGDSGISYTTIPSTNAANTFTAPQSIAPPSTLAPSTSALLVNPIIYTGGTGTTTYPAVAIWPTAATAPTTWSTNGTALGFNLPSGFTGNAIDVHVNGGASNFSVTQFGGITAGNAMTINTNNSAGIALTGTSYMIVTQPAAQLYSYLARNLTAATVSNCALPGGIGFSGSYWTGAASGTNITTITPSCTPGANGAETLTIGNTGSTGMFTATVAGEFTAQTIGGTQAATIAAGAAAGTSPTIACAASHTCTAVNGTISITTGTATSTGALLTVTAPSARTNLPDCLATISLTASPYTAVTANAWSYTTTVATLSVGAALTASTAYTVVYHCLGY